MRDAVMRALAKEPAERFGSAADMASALRKANAQPAGGPTPNPTDAPTERLEEPTTAAVGEQATRRWARTRRQPRAASPAAEAQSRARRPIVIAVAALVALAVGLAVTQPWAGKGDRNNPVSSADAAKATASTDGSGPSSHADGAPADPGPPERTVPTLRGLAVSGARARARHHHLVMAVHRHASRRVGDGLVISQTPVPGELVSDGATVAVNVSTGPPPVSVPDVSGDSSAYAARQLSVAGLTSSTTSTSSSKPAGTVLSQSPDAGDEVAPGTSVQLTVAAPKAWHTVDTFTADGESSSDIFRIRGSRWRLTYTLTFSHCDFSCYPPSIYIHNKAGTDFRNFSLKDGTHTTSVPMPPGHYYVEVTSVSQDDFTVDVKVEDYA
jgi:eukaryotic-like serine/threonine-protein kinase